MSSGIDLEEWQKTTFETHQHLRNLQLADDQHTQQLIRALAGEADDETRQKKRLVVTQLRQGLALETTSFVGRIQLDDLAITIRPKIKMLPLLHLLQYTYELRQLDRFAHTSFTLEELSFQDLLIYQFEQEVRDLVGKGLHRSYMRREEQLASPRGRLNVLQLARQGGIVQEKLPCIYYTRLDDHLLNQVLLAGVKFACQLTNSDYLLTRLQNLDHFHLTEISSLRLTCQILKNARRTQSRLTSHYSPALTLIEILLTSEGISLDNEQAEISLPGFLFDMNKFYQDLIQRFLQENLPEYDILAQYEITDMLRYSENPRHKRSPELRPDYVIKQRGQTVAILDAKYRDLWQYDLPPHMLYQLVMYSLSHINCHHATILYPTTHSHAREARIDVQLPSGHRSSVNLRPVDLLKLEEMITGDQSGNESARLEFANWLAFGNR